MTNEQKKALVERIRQAAIASRGVLLEQHQHLPNNSPNGAWPAILDIDHPYLFGQQNIVLVCNHLQAGEKDGRDYRGMDIYNLVFMANKSMPLQLDYLLMWDHTLPDPNIRWLAES